MSYVDSQVNVTVPTGILTNSKSVIDFNNNGNQRSISMQIQNLFVASGWAKEVRSSAVPSMRYDLKKGDFPIEIEIGHQRLVFPDFLEFMADYSAMHIPAALMIVTGNPMSFGANWHCSVASTRRKIEAIQMIYQVPTMVIGVDP